MATNEEILAIADKQVRGIASSLLAVPKNTDLVAVQAWFSSTAGPILAGMADSDIVPNTTGLAGAVDLTKAEFEQLRQIELQILGLYQTNAALFAKAVGINAG